MNSTSPSCRSVSSAARSPARVSTGPAVMRNPAPISVATIPASDVLPRPGGPAKRMWSTGWRRWRGRLQHDPQVLDQLRLPDELGQRPGPQPDLLGLFGTVGRRRIDHPAARTRGVVQRTSHGVCVDVRVGAARRSRRRRGP